MTRIRTISVLTFALLLSGGVASAQVATGGTSAATTVNATAVGPTQVSVTIGDNSFTPHNVVVTRGSTVVWRNQGTATHSVFSDRGLFSSGGIVPGGSFSHVFNETGTFLYHDPAYGGAGGTGMFGIVVVLPPETGASAAPTATATNGGATSLSGTVVAPTTFQTTAFPTGFPQGGAGGAAQANWLVLMLSGVSAVAGLGIVRRRLHKRA